jgi:uncharacterized protein (TIGR03437 family)
MTVKWIRILSVAALMPVVAMAATFGTVVQVHGAVADIAIDETRGNLFAANFAAYRVEVISAGNASILTNVPVAAPPSAVAVSPDAHYLVIGLYQTPVSNPSSPNGFIGGFQPNTGGLVILDLTTGSTVQTISLNNPVLSVAFGSDGKALVVVSASQQTGPNFVNVYLLTPASGNLTPLSSMANGVLAPGSVPIYSRILPQNPTAGEAELLLATPPSQIIQTATAVSSDKNTITILGSAMQDDSATSKTSVTLRYDVPSQTMYMIGMETTPPQGPRSVASDATGTNIIEGWSLLKWVPQATCYATTPPLNLSSIGPGFCMWAQYQGVNGAFQSGSHAWDVKRNLIYTQIPANNDGPVLHVAATDNLEILERLQIPEGLTGTSFMSSDGNTMYATSASGVTIFPIGQLPNIPQIAATQEDVLFANNGNGCTPSTWTQTLTINSFSSAQADFTLSLPQNATGVTLSATSGTTPAQVQITVDPTAFPNINGTVTIPLTITSNAAVNLPAAVRLLINLRGPTQVGRIFNVPGKIVDMLADPARSRLYLLRQDRNLVEVFDMATLTNITNFRTGNTPTQMNMTPDQNYLVVGNDNSMIANVIDLNAMAVSSPIVFPFGHYPRSIGFTYSNSFGLMRNAGLAVPLKNNTPNAVVDEIDFANRVAFTPGTLSGATNPSIYSNDLSSFDGIMTASGDAVYLTMALSDGTLAEFDSTAGAWVASRQDVTSLAGSYGALSDTLWNFGPNLVDGALVPLGSPFPSTDGTPSGVAPFLGIGVRTSATAATDPGVIQLINTINYTELDRTLMAEAPVTNASLSTTPVGLIGETIPSFTRSLAVSPDQSTIYALTTSGLTILPGNFYVPPVIPVINSIVSTSDNVSPAATGGLVSISGNNFSVGSGTSGFPLATSIASANGEPVPLYYVSPSLINAQLPYDVNGNASIVVTGPSGVSQPFSLSVQPQVPSIFLNTTAAPGMSIPFITREANGLLVTPSNPVQRSDKLLIYVNGLGITTPPATAGVAAPSSPLEEAVNPPTVTIGGTAATLLDSSLAPGVAGVYQVLVSVPISTPIGLSVPLTISAGGLSQTVSVRVIP